MNLSQEAKVIIGIAVATIIIVVGAVFFLSNPSQQQQQATKVTDTKKLLGDEKHVIKATGSKVTIVEFGDYQCPACGAAYPTVKQVLADYKGKINFVWRNFPLPMHQNAVIAAVAAEAAGDQGKFWEMHDMLYENQGTWGESTNAKNYFMSYAQKLGLDTTKFKDALDKKLHVEYIQHDEDDGIALGVNSTPTFFINGEMLPGVLSYEQFKEKIDAASK